MIKPGAMVKYGPLGGAGSVGRVLEVNQTGGVNQWRYNVMWIYGQDVKGEPITSVSRHLHELDLTEIRNEDLFNRYVRAPAWSAEQKALGL